MKIENLTLKISKTDLDHILGAVDLFNSVPSEDFMHGVKIELELHGLENECFNKIEIKLDWLNEELEG